MRCVSIDFHTSPLIPDVGARFDKKKFADTYKAANAEQVLVFAKCHHGYTYYPTKVGTMNPNLDFDLLGSQLEALRGAGIKAPIYVTFGWSKLDADTHKEWMQVRFDTKEPLYFGTKPTGEETEDSFIKDCSWAALCAANPDYLDHVEALTRELCERYDVSDGIFYDICFMNDACACNSCQKGMLEAGLDPDNYEDAKKYYIDSHVGMMKRLTGVIHEYFPNAPVFYNGGADMNRTEYHPYQSNFILEDLPTAWGGYDLMPVRTKFFEKYGKQVIAMTAKFHHNWGEFGGFKNKDALKYECADMLSVGADIYVGDHMHPSGEPDESTYAVIGHAFDYVKSIEKYCYNSRAYTDLALWLSHDKRSDIGASKLLQVMHLEYDVIEDAGNIGKYKCIILPDRVKLTEADKKALVDFTERGGKIVASYESVFDELGIKKLEPSAFDQDYIKCDIDIYKTPYLAYSSAYKTESDGECLAEVYEPYFSRTFGHFSGHKNTPYKPEPASYPALVRRGNVLYFAHPIFEAYDKSGNFVLECYAKRAISEFYDKMIKTEELPSCGRIRIRENKDEGFLALHVLYAPPVNRGNVCLLPDFPKLHGVKISVKTDKNIKSATLRPDGTSVPFEQKNGEITLSLPPFSMHALVTLKY